LGRLIFSLLRPAGIDLVRAAQNRAVVRDTVPNLGLGLYKAISLHPARAKRIIQRNGAIAMMPGR
jgi:hypothetical protein